MNIVQKHKKAVKEYIVKNTGVGNRKILSAVVVPLEFIYIVMGLVVSS